MRIYKCFACGRIIRDEESKFCAYCGRRLLINYYTHFEGPELLEELGDDASKWAEAFMQLTEGKTVNYGLMLGWFANAIEHSTDVRKWKKKEEEGCTTCGYKSFYDQVNRPGQNTRFNCPLWKEGGKNEM